MLHIGQEEGLHGRLKKKQADCKEAIEAGGPMLQFATEQDKGHFRTPGEFVRQIRGETSPLCPVDDAIVATRVCLNAAKPHLEGHAMEVAEITPENCRGCP